jgi:hypothetical protein
MKKILLEKQIEELKRKLVEAKAQSISNAHFVVPQLKKFGRNSMIGSCVIVQIKSLGGSIDTKPFSISDGLSQETLAALEKDIRRNFNHQLAYGPDGFTAIPEFE